jgi:hypothetical protein
MTERLGIGKPGELKIIRGLLTGICGFDSHPLRSISHIGQLHFKAQLPTIVHSYYGIENKEVWGFLAITTLAIFPDLAGNSR